MYKRQLKRRGAAPAGAPAPAAGAAPAGEAPAAARDDGARGVAAAQAALLDVAVLKDRSKAFDLFRRSYRRNQAIEDNKAVRPLLR